MGKKLEALKDVGLGSAGMLLSPASGLAAMEIQAQQDRAAGKKGSGATLLAEDARRFGRTTVDEFKAGAKMAKRGVAKLLGKDEAEAESEDKKKGGIVSASRRADGIAQRGKTRGKLV